jgi:hypothetical protein
MSLVRQGSPLRQMASQRPFTGARELLRAALAAIEPGCRPRTECRFTRLAMRAAPDAAKTAALQKPLEFGNEAEAKGTGPIVWAQSSGILEPQFSFSP